MLHNIRKTLCIIGHAQHVVRVLSRRFVVYHTHHITHRQNHQNVLHHMARAAFDAQQALFCFLYTRTHARTHAGTPPVAVSRYPVYQY